MQKMLKHRTERCPMSSIKKWLRKKERVITSEWVGKIVQLFRWHEILLNCSQIYNRREHNIKSHRNLGRRFCVVWEHSGGCTWILRLLGVNVLQPREIYPIADVVCPWSEASTFHTNMADIWFGTSNSINSNVSGSAVLDEDSIHFNCQYQGPRSPTSSFALPKSGIL